MTPQELNNFASYCEAQVEDIRGAIVALSGQVVDLCSAPYEGPASQMLMADMQAVSGEAEKMHLAMNDIAANLRQNAVTYVNGETQNVTNLQAATAAISAANGA